jgi:hypothetical protein
MSVRIEQLQGDRRIVEVLCVDHSTGALTRRALTVPAVSAGTAPRHPKRRRPEKLGIDIGGVVIGRGGDAEDTSLFGDDYLDAGPVVGALDGIRRLVDGRFAGNVFVVSKCGPKIAARTLEWLSHHDFFERTGLPAGHLYFTRTRGDKAPVCARLGLTHFVDDRLDVLDQLLDVEYR